MTTFIVDLHTSRKYRRCLRATAGRKLFLFLYRSLTHKYMIIVCGVIVIFFIEMFIFVSIWLYSFSFRHLHRHHHIARVQTDDIFIYHVKHYTLWESLLPRIVLYLCLLVLLLLLICTTSTKQQHLFWRFRSRRTDVYT